MAEARSKIADPFIPTTTHRKNTEVRVNLKHLHRNANKISTEVKDMYTNGPPNNILKLSEPLRSVIENSRLWKWERSRNLEITNCIATLFPEDNTQDVSLTIWCANNGGYLLNDLFGLQLANLS